MLIRAILILGILGFLAAVGGLTLGPSGATVASGLAIIAAGVLAILALRATYGMPRLLAIGMVAVAAILPEYSVDGHYAWMGAGPHTSEYSPLTLAATTSAIRLLVGVGWPIVIVAFWVKNRRRPLRLDADQGVGLALLLLASLYAFAIYLKGFVWLFDAAILLMLFGVYMWRGSILQYIQEVRLKPFQRRLDASVTQSLPDALVVALFGYATLLVYLMAGPFADGLLTMGRETGIGQFTLVQGMTPIVSKTPWMALFAVLVWQGRSGVAVSTLLTFLVAQWTLLVALLALIPVVSGLVNEPSDVLGLGDRQRSELLLTAAQSLFLVALLSKLSVSWRSALSLVALFGLQWLLVGIYPDKDAMMVQGLFTVIYLSSASAMILVDRSRLSMLAGIIAPRRRPATSHRDVLTPHIAAKASRERRSESMSGVASPSDTAE